MYRLVAMDLDDTLWEADKRILPGTVDVLRRLLEKGVHIAIASGRITQTQMRTSAVIGDKVSYVSYNGAVVIFEDGGKVEYQVPTEVIRDVVLYCRERKLFPISYNGGGIYVEQDSPLLRQDIDTQCADFLKVIDMTGPDLLPSPKVVVITDPDRADTVVAELADRYPDMIVTRSSPPVIEIMPHGVDKAHGLSLVCEELGIEPKDAVVIGDNYNDISMVTWAGLGVAVGNAVDDLKKVAGMVTEKQRSAGVEEALRRIFSDLLSDGNGILS